MRKDKAKVLDEQWDDERVASFLELRPGDGAESNADYALLLRAYQSMRDSDFARFVPLFREAGRDINATGPDGKTLLELIGEHRYGEPYAKILEGAGGA